MDILVHQQRETTTNREKGQDSSRKNIRKSERRKSTRDRRRLVNDGIVVNLSTSKNNRRSPVDRRHSFVLPHIAKASQQRSASSFVNIIA